MLRLLIVGGLLVVTGQLPTGSPGDPITTTTTVEPELTTTVNYSRNQEKYLPRIGPKNKALDVREPLPQDGAPRTNEEFLKKFGVPGPKEGADDPKNAVYGVFGKNYYTWNGRPYINCAVSVSNERPLDDEVDEFGNKTEKKNSETQRCFLDLGRSYDQLSCMTVFMYKGSEEMLKNETKPRKKIVIQSQGCWTNQAHAIETCTKGPACIHAGIIHGGRQMFCCCKEHNCNDHLELDPGAETNPKYFDIARWQHDNMEGVIKHEELKQVDPNKKPEPPGIWLEFVVFFISVIFIGALAACVYGINQLRKRKNKQDGGQADEALLPNEEPQKKIWEIVTNSMHEIGQGKYGMVYKAEYRPSPDAALKTVAVKVFKGNNQSFQNELTIYNDNCMKKCMKGSILRLLDYDIAEQTLITEYHEMGNLHHFLKNRTIDQPLDCLSLIVSLLEALTFLHEERGLVHGDPKPVILHRDIKSHNVLLRMDSRNRLVGVIMDFGLSMRCSQVFDGEMNIKNMMHKVVGTQRYMAPELLVGAAELDITHFKAIDVYAMALVIWEILSRTKVFLTDEVPPYMEPLESDLRKEQPRDPIRLSTYRLVVVAQKKRPDFRKAILEDRILTKVTNSLEEMWEHDAGCRVSAACVLRRMEVLFDEGYHSGTMDGGQSNCSIKSSQESDLEKTPPPSRTSSPEDEATDNTTVVSQADEINSPSILIEATKLLSTTEKLESRPEEIELQEVR